MTVRATTANQDRIVDILDDDGTVDMDQRQTAWRSEGWTGRYTGSGTGGTMSDAASSVGRAASKAADKVSDAASAAGSAMGLNDDRRGTGTATGRSDVSSSRRVRSYPL